MTSTVPDAGLPVGELLRIDLAPVLTHTEITYRVALKLGDLPHHPGDAGPAPAVPTPARS